MKGLLYQLKSVRKDKFCIMSFLLPIVVAVALNFVGSIDLSSLGEFHFGVTAKATTSEVNTWLERYGTVTVYPTQEELIEAINEPSTNLIGVEMSNGSIQTILSGDELDMFQQTANTLPALYEQREWAAQASVQVLERPDMMAGYQNIFIAITLIVAMFMGCTFNAMNIISEKEDGVAPTRNPAYDAQAVHDAENLCGFCIRLPVRYSYGGHLLPALFHRGGGHAGIDRPFPHLCRLDRFVCRQTLRWHDGRRGLY